MAIPVSAAPSARSILSALPKARIAELSRDFDVVLKATATKEEQVTTVLRRARPRLRDVLRALSRDELKKACRSHHVEDGGRARDELMARLLGALRPDTHRPVSTGPDVDRLVPVPGDIAHVRQRQFLVTEVTASDPDAMTRVRLACLDDDAQGSELEVLWELELGARVVSAGAHPFQAVERLDEPRTFAAYLHALQWSRVTAKDARLFQSPFRAGILLRNYQLTPLMKALELPRVNLFIADDVGLGKTIEAGLVMQEMLLRQRVDWVLIVCPAALTRQWQGEMERRFGLRFEIYNREFVARRRQERGFSVNPWSTHHRFVISYQTFRRPEYRDPLIHLLGDRRKKSLLVLDEAHTAAPASSNRYGIDSDTTKSIRDLTTRFENRLFLSATPHNGHSNSFSSLLEMLDPQRFLRGTTIDNPAVLEPVLVRRLKADLREQSVGGFPTRRLVRMALTHDSGRWRQETSVEGEPAASVDLGSGDAPELELAELLQEYTALVGSDNKRSRLVFVNLQKRLLSSIESFARTLEKHAVAVLGEARPEPEDGMDGSEDEEGVGASADTLDAQENATVTITSRGLVRPTGHALSILKRMRALARQSRHAPDAKVRALLDWIRNHQCPSVALGGARAGKNRWSDQRLILFTEYGHTKGYLRSILSAAFAGTDQGDERILVFDGGMSERGRALVQRHFNDSPDKHPVRILLATDAAREGVNLQGHCADLLHWELPWNPARLEQRNGRIDRTLQPSPEVRCMYFTYPQRIEDRVLETVIRKIDTIQRELGSAAAVVMEQISGALDHGIRTETGARIEAAEVSGRSRKAAQGELEGARRKQKLLAKDIAEAGKILDESRAFIDFVPDRLRDAIDVGLALSGVTPLTSEVSPDEEPNLPCFSLPALGQGWERTLDSVRPPREDGEKPWDWRKRPLLPVCLEPPERLGTDVVHLHLQHPFVQRILGRFLAQGFAAHDLSRVTVVRSKKDATPRVLSFARVTLFGAGATRLHDEVVAATAMWPEFGAPLEVMVEKRDRTLERLEQLFAESPSLAVITPRVQGRVRKAAPGHFDMLWPQLQAEAMSIIEDVTVELRRRGETEAKALRKILDDQAALAERTLLDSRQLTLEEMNADERRQIDDDRRYLEERLRVVQSEGEREPQALRAIYEVLQTRVVPVGMVYVWPATRG
jgi:hypothetical protein